MTDQRERVEEFSRELRDESGPSDRSVREIIQALQPQVQELVSKQVELAKSEITPVAKRAGIAAGLLAAAGVVMLVFLILLSFTGVYILALFLPLWVSALIVTGVLLVIAAILGGIGASILRSLDPAPRRTIRGLQQNVDWVKGQLKS